MVLLPLVDQAIPHERTTAGVGRLHVRTASTQARVVVDLSDDGTGILPRTGTAALDAIRERLAALYGPAAALDVLERDGATALVLTIPHER